MKAVATIIVGATLCLMAESTPVSRPLPPTPPKSHVARVLNVSVPTCTTKDQDLRVRNGMIGEQYRWKSFDVFIDPAYDEWERDAINAAMWELMDILPCVPFGIYPPGSRPVGDYVYIVKGDNNGCNSFVGRLGGRQNTNLESPGCMGVSTIMHEMIHALGFQHEHESFDRDDYVNIHWENIEPQYRYAFGKLPSSMVTNFGVPYNYNSIMHYDSYAFSTNFAPTITTKDGGIIESNDNLQDTDIQKLNLMYNC